MCRVRDLCEDSNDNGEWSNTASVPSFPLSRKRIFEATDRDGGSEDSKQANRGDESANKYSQKLSNAKPLLNASGRQGRYFAWEDRLSELAEYRKIHGHCHVPLSYSKNSKLANWVGKQRSQYRLHLAGKPSQITLPRIQELESLGFNWSTVWGDRLSELAEYRKIHGHCNVPHNYIENSKLGKWVGTQRTNYRLHLKGETSSVTLSRIQELESIGFEWGVSFASWEDRLSELADYHKIHGHWNVPTKCTENTKLGKWVGKQKQSYRLHQEGKRSQMTLPRIHALESMGFEWGTARKDRLRELAVYRKIHGHCNVPYNCRENTKLATWVSEQRIQYKMHREGKRSQMTLSRIQGLESLGFEWKKGTPKKPSLDIDARSVHERAVLPPRLPRPAHEQKSINSLSHAVLLVAAPQENDCLVAARKPANSRQAAEIQLETAHSNEMHRTDPSAAELLQLRHNVFTHALLLGDGSSGSVVQATPDKAVNAPPNMQHTPRDAFFQSDNVLNKLEMELIWLGEESMYCLVCPEFQFDFIYEYASPALKMELRKLSRDDQSETEKLKQIVRMEDWLVSRHFDFTRKDIRMNYF
jgi:hypothetical protein